MQRDKLVLGIPTYGRTAILYEPNQIFRANYEEEMDMEEALAKSEGSLPYYEVRCKICKYFSKLSNSEFFHKYEGCFLSKYCF